MNSEQAEGVEPEDPIQAKHVRKFVSLCKQMNRLMDEIRDYEPKANLYLQEDSLHLMVGDSHSADVAGRPQYDNSVESVLMPYASGGAW